MLGIAPAQLQDLALAEVYLGPSLKPAKVPLNGIDVYMNRGVLPCQIGSNRI